MRWRAFKRKTSDAFAQPGRNAMKAGKGGAGEIVLIVEDEPMQRMLMADMLYHGGFWSVEASDAYQALRLLESRPDIRIVFTDIKLPYGMDGLELAAIVRQRWPEIEIALTSGILVGREDAIPDRAVFFQKPYRSQDVLTVLQRMVH
jgi:CheY-like chemotaxis protein